MAIDEEIQALKARLSELERRKAEAAQPTVSAQSDKSGRMPILIVAAGGVVAVALTFAALASSGEAKKTEPQAQPVASEDWKAKAEAFKPGAGVGLPVDATLWRYTSHVDSMSGKAVRVACVTSNNRVELDFPYRPASVDLCIRRRSGATVDIYYSLNGDGQILCDSYNGCQVRVRFDDGAAQSFRGLAPEDHSTNMVFIGSEAKFLASLKHAKLARIGVTYYQAGQQVVEFPVDGFDVAKIGAAAK